MLCGATQPNAQPPKTSSKHSPISTHSCGICQLVRLYQPLHTRCASTSPFYHPLLCSHAFALLEFLYALQLCHSLISQPVKQSVSTSEPYALLFVCVCVCSQSCSGKESTSKKAKHNKCANFIEIYSHMFVQPVELGIVA